MQLYIKIPEFFSRLLNVTKFAILSKLANKLLNYE